MKHGIRLTLKEKKLLESLAIKPKYYLRIKRITNYYEFVNIKDGSILKLKKVKGEWYAEFPAHKSSILSKVKEALL